MTTPHPDDARTDPFEAAEAAATRLAELTGVPRHDVALVLGSGWAPAADLLGETVAEVPLAELPGFRGGTVPGQVGTCRSVRITGTARHVLVLGGRVHLYEGAGVRAVAHGVRTAARAGCSTVVLTNGCGGLRSQWPPGTVVLISDHLNLTGRSPLEGPTFVDLTDLYSTRLRQICHEADPALPQGVYAQLPGPHYETPAEVRMIRTLGGDLVGMSTALEAIAARHAGLEVLGVCLVTNFAAGTTQAPLNHSEVIAAGQAAAQRCGRLLADVVQRIP